MEFAILTVSVCIGGIEHIDIAEQLSHCPPTQHPHHPTLKLHPFIIYPQPLATIILLSVCEPASCGHLPLSILR